jgi:hypothetical protein
MELMLVIHPSQEVRRGELPQKEFAAIMELMLKRLLEYLVHYDKNCWHQHKVI